MNQLQNHAGLAFRLLQGAKDLVWLDVPGPHKPPVMSADKASSAPVTATAGASARAARDAAPSPGNPSAMSAMSAELLALVMNRPTAYSALDEAIAALAEIPMDEATRYRSAFAVLKQTQQRTALQVTAAIDVHLGVLESEYGRFKGQSKSAEDQEITARIQEVAALNLAIGEHGKEIAKLRADTEALIKQISDDVAKKQQRANDLSRQTEQKKQAIMQTNANFEAASEAVKAKLASEKAKIAQYIVG